jgi:hypothetical protein
MAPVSVKTFTSCPKTSVNHATLLEHAEYANHKLNALNATCTRGTNKNLSIQCAFAGGNFRQSITLVSSVILKDVRGAKRPMRVCIVHQKTGMNLQ